MLLFAEGFDDYATNADLQLSGTTTSGCTVVVGRGGKGFAVHIPVGNAQQAAWSFPASATVIAGFALQSTGVDAGDPVLVNFNAGATPIFTIRQNTLNGLQFLDSRGTVIGSAAFNNWSSYIEVKLLTGTAGNATVRINGAQALNAAGNFGVLHQIDFSTILAADTTMTLLNGLDIPAATPLPLTIAIGPYTIAGETYEVLSITARSGVDGALCAITRGLAGTTPSNHTQTTTDPLSYYTLPGCDSISLSNGVFQSGAPSLDDLYVCDNTGAFNHDFLGDTRIVSSAPTGDGADTQWTPLSGGSHFAMVAESPLDYDTSYNSAPAINLSDTFTFSAPSSATGLLRGVQMVAYARTESGGPETLAGVARIAGVDYPSASHPVPAVYAAVAAIFETNPATAVAWTFADVTAAQFGLERTA